ncbi:MAG: hypothetical protein AAF799_42205 [Myxococcota bacterium]
MGNGVKALAIGLAVGSFGVVTGCGGDGTATATERLWISNVPTDPKIPMTAFLTMRSGDRFLGAFFQGSLLRGHHDVFHWTPGAKNKAEVEFLQDGRKVQLRLETCKPTRGFDHCLDVHGDPTGTVRYQSRKRWVVRRPGKKVAALGMVTEAMSELAEDDAELAAVFEAAAEVTAP